MEMKDCDDDIDHEVNAKVEELDHQIEELDRKKKEFEDVKIRFNEVLRQYHQQPGDSNEEEKDGIKKRFEDLMIDFNKTTEHIRLALGPVVHCSVGGSSRESDDDVKMGKGKGKDVLISRGSSEESQEVDKDSDVKNDSLEHRVSTDNTEDNSNTLNLADSESIDTDKELCQYFEELDAKRKEVEDLSKRISRDYNYQPTLNEIHDFEQLRKAADEMAILVKKITAILFEELNKPAVKSEGHDCDFDHEVNARVAELDHYIEELNRKKKELEDVKMKFNEVSRQHHLQPDDSNKKEKVVVKKRLKELMVEFNKTTEPIRLALGPSVHSGVGVSSQEAGDDVKMEKGKGKELLISGGDSEESEEVKKQGDVKMAKGNDKDVLISGGDSEESEEVKKQGDDVTNEFLEHGVSTDTTEVLATDVEGSEQGMKGY